MTHWIISGSRFFSDERLARAVLRSQFKDGDWVYHGGASGVDTWADEEANRLGCVVRLFSPDVHNIDRKAGVKRSREMCDAARLARDNGACVRALILWDGTSQGTEHMLKLVESYGIPVTLIRAGYV